MNAHIEKRKVDQSSQSTHATPEKDRLCTKLGSVQSNLTKIHEIYGRHQMLQPNELCTNQYCQYFLQETLLPV